jgi:uncharacterized membrane protein
MSEIQGLPAHPLLVHGPIVLIPLLALLMLVLVVKRDWRASVGPWVVLLGIVAVVMTVLAGSSGEQLEANVPASELVHRHAEIGESMRPIAFAMLIALVLLVAPAWAYRRGGPGALVRLAETRAWSIISVVLVVATAVLGTYWIIRTGHSGAESVWHDVKMVNSEKD